MNILFFHGLDSSAETTKFTVIKNENKVSFTVDYRKLSFHEVGLLYDKFIEMFNPDILVGHSLGGYWALKNLMIIKFHLYQLILHLIHVIFFLIILT